MRSRKTFRYKVKRLLNLKRALRLVWQSAPGWALTNVPLLLIQGALELLALYLMKLMIEAVALGLKTFHQGIAFKQVAIIIGISAVVALVGVFCRSLTDLVKVALAQAVTDHMHDTIHAKSVEVDLEYYENSRYYDTLHRAKQEAPYRPTRIVSCLVEIVQKSILLLVIAGLLFALDWRVAIILFASFVPGVFDRLKHAREIYRLQQKRTSAERQAQYFSGMLTESTHAKELRLFDLGTLFMRRFRDLRKQLRQERIQLAVRRSISDAAVHTISILLVFGALAFIAYRTVSGAVTIGDLVMYYIAFQRGQLYMRPLLLNLGYLVEDSLFLTHLYEFLDLERKVIEPSHPQPIPRPLQKGIVFDHVSFDYPNAHRKVLDDITFTIRPGEKVAIVGDNGSGKTTLIKLLCRLYDPTKGSITFDGMDLREFETTKLRREISVVFQDYVHYNLSARENIWFGNIDIPPEQERIIAAARDSGADDVISSLKYGYETILGKQFADGEELSIGEWQKVALARAFLRDAQIIVLDEPTSAMDAKAEYEVFKKFYQLAEGRTAIFISHRLSTVKMADCIYVMEDGRIIERGTHHELVYQGGKYASLFEIQARHYK